MNSRGAVGPCAAGVNASGVFCEAGRPPWRRARSSGSYSTVHRWITSCGRWLWEWDASRQVGAFFWGGVAELTTLKGDNGWRHWRTKYNRLEQHNLLWFVITPHFPQDLPPTPQNRNGTPRVGRTGANGTSRFTPRWNGICCSSNETQSDNTGATVLRKLDINPLQPSSSWDYRWCVSWSLWGVGLHHRRRLSSSVGALKRYERVCFRHKRSRKKQGGRQRGDEGNVRRQRERERDNKSGSQWKTISSRADSGAVEVGGGEESGLRGGNLLNSLEGNRSAPRSRSKRQQRRHDLWHLFIHYFVISTQILFSRVSDELADARWSLIMRWFGFPIAPPVLSLRQRTTQGSNYLLKRHDKSHTGNWP